MIEITEKDFEGLTGGGGPPTGKAKAGSFSTPRLGGGGPAFLPSTLSSGSKGKPKLPKIIPNPKLNSNNPYVRHTSVIDSIPASSFEKMDDEEISRLKRLDSLANRPQPERLYPDEYFPARSNNINKGTYSGGTFSAPVFAASSLVPFGYMDANQRAISAAAQKKLDEITASQIDYEPPTLANPLYQKQFNEAFYSSVDSHVSKAKDMAGDKWVDYLRGELGENTLSRSYKQTLQNFEFLQKELDNVTNLASEVELAYRAGDKYVSKDAYKSAREISSAIGSYADGTIDPKNMPKLVAELEMEQSLTGFLKDQEVLKDMTIHVQAAFDNNPWQTNGDYDIYKKEIESSIEKQAELMAKQFYDEQFHSSSVITSADVIKDRLMGMVGDQIDEKLEIIRKPKASRVYNTTNITPPGQVEKEVTTEAMNLQTRTVRGAIAGDPSSLNSFRGIKLPSGQRVKEIETVSMPRFQIVPGGANAGMYRVSMMSFDSDFFHNGEYQEVLMTPQQYRERYSEPAKEAFSRAYGEERGGKMFDRYKPGNKSAGFRGYIFIGKPEDYDPADGAGQEPDIEFVDASAANGYGFSALNSILTANNDGYATYQELQAWAQEQGYSNYTEYMLYNNLEPGEREQTRGYRETKSKQKSNGRSPFTPEASPNSPGVAPLRGTGKSKGGTSFNEVTK